MDHDALSASARALTSVLPSSLSDLASLQMRPNTLSSVSRVSLSGFPATLTDRPASLTARRCGLAPPFGLDRFLISRATPSRVSSPLWYRCSKGAAGFVVVDSGDMRADRGRQLARRHLALQRFGQVEQAEIARHHRDRDVQACRHLAGVQILELHQPAEAFAPLDRR